MGSLQRFVNAGLRRFFTGTFAKKACGHLELINDVEPSSNVCDQCVELGETWPALRMCLICGHVGCCQDAKYQHALRHYEETGHPLIKPYLEGSMDWIWCFEDEALLDSV